MFYVLWPLGFLWSLPGSLVGIVLVLIGGGPTFAMAESGALIVGVRRIPIPSWAIGQTWGVVVLVCADVAGKPAECEMVLAHEAVHVRQWMVLGPLFMLAYPLSCAVAWARGGKPYEDNWFEKQARKAERR